MRSLSKKLLPFVLALLLVACDGRVERTDGGGVLLTVSDFDGVPLQVSVDLARLDGFVAIDSITITSVIKDLDSQGSALMDVEMSSYEVTFSRAGSGTLLPPPLVANIFGNTPAGGTNAYENLPILTLDQINSRPLSDLFFENGGFDKETGLISIPLNITIRFFGRTIAGEAVDTAPVSFTVQFVA